MPWPVSNRKRSEKRIGWSEGEEESDDRAQVSMIAERSRDGGNAPRLTASISRWVGQPSAMYVHMAESELGFDGEVKEIRYPDINI